MRAFCRNAGVVAVAALSATASVSRAQAIKGTVVDSMTTLPLAGAVVYELGADGRQLFRTLTGIAGEFRIPQTPGAVRTRIVHIGYEPIETSTRLTSGVRFAMRHIPAQLPGIQVTGQTVCPGTPAGVSTFRLWEQARAGLLTAVVAREQSAGELTTLVYQRHESPVDSVIHEQQVRIRHGMSARPFLAPVNPETLARQGYVTQQGRYREFLAPDADVLLDEAFANTHCFRQVSTPANASVTGLKFSPASNSSAPTDVTGTIWMSAAASLTLDSVDFRYTGLEDAERDAQGKMRFVTPASGATFVQEWLLQIPVLEARRVGDGSFDAGRFRRTQSTELVVKDLFVAGGIVRSAQWPDGSHWLLPPSGIRGLVIDHLSHQPVAGALVTFEGTSDTLVTDERGTFTHEGMIPGSYLMRVSDTSLAAVHRDRADSRIVRITDQRLLTDTIQLPAISESIAQVCGSPAARSDPAVLIGRLLLPDSAVKGARIQVSWRVLDPNLYGSKVRELSRDVDVDSRGRFVVCGLPLDQSLAVHLSLTKGAADTAVTIQGSYVKALQWQPIRPD